MINQHPCILFFGKFFILFSHGFLCNYLNIDLPIPYKIQEELKCLEDKNIPMLDKGDFGFIGLPHQYKMF